MYTSTCRVLLVLCCSLLPVGMLLAQDKKMEAKIDSAIQAKKEKPLPLEPARKIRLQTNEGTWMSVDVSPDGKTIVFDLLGDLYLLPISGGKADTLTSGMAYDTHPRFSPDGKKIVFTSDRDGSENIWTIEVGSKETKQVSQDKTGNFQSAEWTPDGKYLIVSKGVRNLKLFMYHMDGGTGIQLIKEPDEIKAIEPAFGSAARYIWFSQRRSAWNYNAQLPQYQLATYDRETGELQTRTNRYGSAFTPTLSPDGKWLVYGSRYNNQTGLVKRNTVTGDEDWLAYPVQRDEQESIAPLGVLPAMSFTPDSKEVIASYGGKIYRIPVAGGIAMEVPFQVDTEIDLGPQLSFEYPIGDEPDMTVTQIRDAVLSHNGKNWLLQH